MQKDLDHMPISVSLLDSTVFLFNLIILLVLTLAASLPASLPLSTVYSKSKYSTISRLSALNFVQFMFLAVLFFNVFSLLYFYELH